MYKGKHLYPGTMRWRLTPPVAVLVLPRIFTACVCCRSFESTFLSAFRKFGMILSIFEVPGSVTLRHRVFLGGEKGVSLRNVEE